MARERRDMVIEPSRGFPACGPSCRAVSYPDAIRFSFSCDTVMVQEGSAKLREALV